MTPTSLLYKKRLKTNIFSALVCLTLTGTMLIFSEKIKSGIYNGLVLCATNIIPTLFPFFILSDLWTAEFEIKQDGLLSRFFEKLFGINGAASVAFLSGIICGFPIGVKTATELYDKKIISKNELIHLCGFSNNPSAAFIISGVGAACLGNIYMGIFLFVSTLLSSVTVGILFRKKSQIISNSSVISRQNFDFVSSVKNAGLNSIAVSSYIILFSGVISLISYVINNTAITAVISTFFEVGTSISLITGCEAINNNIKLVLIAFALGFSGFSVHLQAFSFMPTELSRKKYLFMKLCQAVISASFAYIYLLLKK